MEHLNNLSIKDLKDLLASHTVLMESEDPNIDKVNIYKEMKAIQFEISMKEVKEADLT